MGVSIIPGETILIRFGAISAAMPRAKASTAPPTDEIAIWPGRHFLAGEPLTNTIFPLSFKNLVPYLTTFVYPHNLSNDAL